MGSYEDKIGWHQSSLQIKGWENNDVTNSLTLMGLGRGEKFCLLVRRAQSTVATFAMWHYLPSGHNYSTPTCKSFSPCSWDPQTLFNFSISQDDLDLTIKSGSSVAEPL